jgi:hypothetical protein
MSHNKPTGSRGEQLDLFAGFCLPEVPMAPRRVGRPRTAPLTIAAAVQLVLVLAERKAAKGSDDPLPVLHLRVSAASCDLPRTTAPRSIFEMSMALALESAQSADPQPAAEPDQAPSFQDAPHLDIQREAGLVRVKRLHHTETTEWQEREAARRARQKSPRAPAKARTVGRRLAELIGTER